MSKVHSPNHYTKGGIEAIDYIKAKLGPEGFRAYCLGNVMKYVSRWQDKDGEQDLQKALKYMEWAANNKEMEWKEIQVVPPGLVSDTSHTKERTADLLEIELKSGTKLSIELSEQLMNNLNAASTKMKLLDYKDICEVLRARLQGGSSGNLVLKLSDD